MGFFNISIKNDIVSRLVYSAARTVHVFLYKVSFYLKLIMSYYLLNSPEVFEGT